MEAGHVEIDRPAIIEVDTSRAIADGNTIAGKSVFLTTDMPSDYPYQVEKDDPVLRLLLIGS